MHCRLYLILLFILPSFYLPGQGDASRDPIPVINTCIEYANESIHGMLIAHRLFENYNQDINQYVDLPGHQLNFYNNRDLPLDIFDDPDHWFYEKSPSVLFKESNAGSLALPQKDRVSILSTLENIRSTTRKSNQLRLFIGQAINTRDLTNPDSLYSIYELLEEAVDAFDVFSAQLLILESQMEKAAQELFAARGLEKYSGLAERLKNIHQNSVAVLRSMKAKDTAGVESYLRDLLSALERFESYSLQSEGGFVSSSYIRNRKRILLNGQQIVAGAQEYLGGQEIPEEYALYGNEYYYYNTQLLNKVNRYGNGMVEAINQVIDLFSLPLLHRLEIPHYLEIIYPQKVEKQLPVIQSSFQELLTIPETLENRTVVSSDKKHVIYVDSAEPTLEIFDHLKQDGDIISLYYNGTWIFENLSLERKPRKFILRLNPKGKNFLILHAVNEGNIPPNTIGINYTDKGRRKRYIMQSNLKTSQLVEININK